MSTVTIKNWRASQKPPHASSRIRPKNSPRPRLAARFWRETWIRSIKVVEGNVVKMRCFQLLVIVVPSLALAELRGPREKHNRDKLIQVEPWIAEANAALVKDDEDKAFWRFLLEQESMCMSLPSPTTPKPPSTQFSPAISKPPSAAPPPTPRPPFSGPPATQPPSACPSLDEPCMNEENFRTCTDLVEDGCKNLLILESCPLQFDCGDSSTYPVCGGIAGTPCEDGLFCYTGISNDCDEDCVAADCQGECRQVLEGEQCLGFAGFQCPDGSECVDEKGDGCSPNCGGADCIGICLVI